MRLSWLIALVMTLLGRAAWAAPIERIERAHFLLDPADEPSAIDGQWSALTLPDRWSERRPGAHGTGWYRMTLAPRERGRWAVMLPQLNMNAEVFLDGRWIGNGGSFVEPVAQNWNRPLLFRLPDHWDDEATLDIRLFAYGGDWGGLSPVLVGDYDVLRQRYDRQWSWQVVPAQIASVVSLVLLLLFVALWLAMGRSPLYGVFALTVASYFIHSLSGHVRDLPVPFGVGRWLIHAAMDWFAVWSVFAAHRWLKLERTRLERVIGGWMVLCTVATALSGDHFRTVALVAHAQAMALAIYGFATFARRIRSVARADASFVLISAAITLGLALHSMAMQFGLLAQDSPRLMHLAAPVILVGMGSVLLSDFVRTFLRAEHRNVELDRRVKEKENELRENFERLRSLERERVLAGERERIMREMHDGIGSSLVSTLSLLERAPADPSIVADSLRRALLDMRVVIDSLDPSADDLNTMLGMLRSRIQPLMQSHGLRIVWNVEDLPEVGHLGPESLLHVMRIVQEAITNALKHADAGEIRLRTGCEGEHVFVEVADDGRGFADVKRGRGLTNMEQRARAIGGRLEVEASRGTRVRIWIPLQLSSEMSPKLTAS